MIKIKPSIILAAICWASLFILTWSIVLNIVPVDLVRGASVAVFSRGRRYRVGYGIGSKT
ncbi:MAG: hypothetical protein KDJ52_01320 [Anaerolineae bacterium]|nr:hypothetical protein [Anaerolineae bacterium]